MSIYTTTLRGTIYTAGLEEIFSHSLSINSSSSNIIVADAVRDAWMLVWNGAGGTINNLFPTGVVYEEATAAPVLEPNPPINIGAAYHSVIAGGAAGVSPGNSLPSQSAVAVSLTGGPRPNGKPTKGRFYLPPLSVNAIVADGRLDPAVQAELADAMFAFLQQLALTGHSPVIWSRTVEFLTPNVTQIRVGDRVDTIRSRRNALAESYIIGNAVAGPGRGVRPLVDAGK